MTRSFLSPSPADSFSLLPRSPSTLCHTYAYDTTCIQQNSHSHSCPLRRSDDDERAATPTKHQESRVKIGWCTYNINNTFGELVPYKQQLAHHFSEWLSCTNHYFIFLKKPATSLTKKQYSHQQLTHKSSK